MHMLQRLDKAAIPYFSFYIFSFMAMALFTVFINVYFHELGFEISQIGMLTALGPTISMVSQPMWGMLSDRSNKKKVFLTVLAGSAIMSIVVSLNTAFIFLVVTLLIYWAFATSMLPLGDALTLGFLEGKALKYSAVRVLGAVSFGLASAFAGRMLGGNTGLIFYYNAAFLTITFLIIFFMIPGKAGTPTKEKTPEDIQEPETGQAKLRFVGLLKNKIVLYVYLSSFVFGLAMSFLHNFFGIRMTEIGATQGQIGMSMFIAGFSEIPIFLFIDRVFGKRKPEYLLMFSAFFMGLRLFIMFLSESVVLIYFAQLVHGLSFVIHLYFCIVLLHKHSPHYMKSTVQTIHAMVRMGASAILGGLGGGFLAQHIGIQNVFLLLSVFVFGSCFILPGVLIIIHKVKTRRSLV